MAESTGTVSVVSNLWTSTSPTAGHGLTYELVVGIFANLLTVVVVVGFLALWEFGVKRRRLFKFFGLAQEKTLRIFIGHIPHQAVPQGLVGFQESSEALRLAELFKSPIPGLSDTPGFLRHLYVADVDVKVEAASRQNSTVNLEQSAISLGAKSTNYASQLIEEQLQCPVRVSGQIEIPGLPAITQRTQAVVVKIRRGARSFFYLAGLDEPSTAAAARFLFKNWGSMRKQYGDDASFYYLVERGHSEETKVIAHQGLTVAN